MTTEKIADTLRQGVWKPETPRERRQVEELAQDLEDSPVTGKPLPTRLRNFRPSADAYFASLGGPRAYMVRLREIERMTADHAAQLAAAWAELVESASDGQTFAAAWRETAEQWSFDELNDLIDKHNRWYPAESRLPMDPKTRDFARINGKDYRLDVLDVNWILERFPAQLPTAA